MAKKHHPIRVWIVMLYLMGLNLSNKQIAAELDLNPDVTHRMTILLRSEIAARKPGCKFKGVVECDEVYVIAGHKGHMDSVKSTSIRLRVSGRFYVLGFDHIAVYPKKT
ncbi:conserved domain protein [delta proteobacterium NaphS2]|nr:conserved domain protein [delta proteobacterium NaphS2]